MVLAQTNAALRGINSFQLIALQPIDLATALSRENGCMGMATSLASCTAALVFGRSGFSSSSVFAHFPETENKTTLTSAISTLNLFFFFLERMGLALRDRSGFFTNK